MDFKFGDKVRVDGKLAVVVDVDEGDEEQPYQVIFPEDPFTPEWITMDPVYDRLVAVCDAVPESALGGPIVAPTTAEVDLFGMPLGQRMRYDNSSARRKDQPVTEGFLDYFPATVRLVAELSRLGNEKHNPGEPLHHARAKSGDHRNCAVRHLMDADVIDPESGLIEAVGAVWRSSAYVQEVAEKVYGWPKAPRAR